MKRSLLRLCSLILAAALLLPLLAACGYRPVKSTEWEATPVFTLGEATVNMEMLHTFFYTQCDDIPGFSELYFSGDAGALRFAAVRDAAVREIAGVYALFAVCQAVGIDPYSEDIDDKITEYIEISVEGGALGDQTLRGFESYDDYLAHIRKYYHMNDAVNRLMIRYALCEELLSEYYSTQYRHTEADVTAFFESEDCIRIIWVNRLANSAGLDLAGNLELMTKARDNLIAGKFEEAIWYSLSETTDFYMGRYTMDPLYYGELIEAAYAMEVGDTSRIMDLGSLGYYVFSKRTKESSALSTQYRQIEKLYLGDVMYGEIAKKQEELLQGIVYTDFYRGLTPDGILNAQ